MGQPTENMGFMGQGRMFRIPHICMLWTCAFHHQHMNLLFFNPLCAADNAICFWPDIFYDHWLQCKKL